MKHPDRPFLIAITGGIASGKSVASKWFEEQNFTVIYADKIGHELYKEQYFIDQIEKIFGNDITITGSVNREKLGETIFNSEVKRKQLNKLLHPEIRKRIQHIINTSSQEILMFEIPLLFENDLCKAFDLTVNISARKDLRINRIMRRDGLTKESAVKRVDSQMSEIDRKKLADINIVNDSDVKNLILQLKELIKTITKLEKKDVTEITKIV
ncbi:MAG: dephospho-CoA kinase [Candidatus Tenebribacter mawsonii]|jgi:dephospho-CoA kinase|nr:dephospho-CoA kinase [Candidatus Tenebribacter mawsonii]